MEEKEIIEGNRLIAEFMGFYITEFNGLYHFVCKEKKKPEHLNQAWEFRLEEAKYHTSWDWLMGVVEKIENKEHSVYIVFEKCEIGINIDGGDRITKIRPSKIEAAWLAVVDFIKWYNSLTPTKPKEDI